ncbi:MAG TPA: hypothetical protein PLJ60_13975 [Chryseolinea sp.]|nr:hypothetical protein [Chryseolinea sp.]HPM31439.1 hypothetical protein [Chryseolinea sp.]
MKTKYLLVLTLAIVALGQPQKSFAQEAASTTDEWTFLGNCRADYTLDHDVIAITEGSSHITALKFIIKQGTLMMHRCTIYFSDGGTKDVEFLDEVNYAANGITMNIPDSEKTIDGVSFWYDTQDISDKKSIVEVWAMNQLPVLN